VETVKKKKEKIKNQKREKKKKKKKKPMKKAKVAACPLLVYSICGIVSNPSLFQLIVGFLF